MSESEILEKRKRVRFTKKQAVHIVAINPIPSGGVRITEMG
jgi:hypothetical protein